MTSRVFKWTALLLGLIGLADAQAYQSVQGNNNVIINGSGANVVIMDGRVVSGSGADTGAPEGALSTEVRAVADFDQVDVTGQMSVIYAYSEQPHVELKGGENALKYLKTTVSQGRLGFDFESNVAIKTPLVIRVYSRALSRVRVTGNADFTANDLISPALSIEVSGHGLATVSGQATEASYQITGSGNISAWKLHADKVSASITGSGNLFSYAKQAVNASVTGNGVIHVRGAPEVRDVQRVGSGLVLFE
jgi:hypothetical protein